MVGSKRIKLMTMRQSQLEDTLLFLYLCLPLSSAIFSKIFSIVDLSSLGRLIALFITYLPLFLLTFCGENKIRVWDFWILFSLIVMFFTLTYWLHPEYEYWYIREDYGVLNYVLRPDNGLFIYLTIRIVNDPDRILKCIKQSGWPMYVFYMWQIWGAISRGYWIDFSNRGYEIHLSYNLGLGYSILIFALTYLYSALESKKISDYIGAFAGISMIMVAGSRGPFLDIAIFIILYLCIKIASSKRKVLLFTGIAVIAGVIWIFYPYFLSLLVQILDNLNISSRFITKLMNGSIIDDTGRNRIWLKAIEMIKEKPLGYGAMGSRHIISQFIYVAHPHQIFLEILIDFGWLAGGLIILFLMFSAIKILLMKDIGKWRGVFCVFFACACQLLVSLTFWHSIGLWGILAVGMCIYYSNGRKVHNGKQ